LGLFNLLELNIGIASALFAIGVCFKFAGNNFTVRLESFKNFLLGNILINILDEEVGILIKGRIWVRLDNTDSKTLKALIVHLSKAAIGLSRINKLKVAIAARFVSSGIKNDLGIKYLVPLTNEELLEVKV